MWNWPRRRRRSFCAATWLSAPRCRRTVTLYPIPSHVYAPEDGHAYAYAIVNGQRVVVDTRTRAVVAIVG